jgi:hypothetical protein
MDLLRRGPETAVGGIKTQKLFPRLGRRGSSFINNHIPVINNLLHVTGSSL